HQILRRPSLLSLLTHEKSALLRLRIVNHDGKVALAAVSIFVLMFELIMYFSLSGTQVIANALLLCRR
ncbi:hypothetical protein, partial [Limnohabitans sp.]|uniref:hypothetical protein n=1 Tax=Limnohabitans sp. TaxID=1907725 RepID=UPI003340AF68